MDKETSDLDYIVELTDEPAPAFLDTLSEAQLHELRVYIEAIVKRDEAGLDKLFESMSLMMKFIPNFILHSLTPKYTEPAIAARITNKLTIKQSVGVTAGLPVDYVAETSVYMKPHHAAEILEALKGEKIKAIVEYMIVKHPLKALDISEYLSEKTLKHFAPFAGHFLLNENELSAKRKAALLRLQQAR